MSKIARAVFKLVRRGSNFVTQHFIPILFPPPLDAFLMRDAEEPAPEFRIVAQAAAVPDGGDERLLHEVEARLFVMHQFENIDIQGQLVASKENVPSLRFPGFGLWHGQLFAFSHYQHLHQVECTRREKVQRD
jgi:hypothetical protein